MNPLFYILALGLVSYFIFKKKPLGKLSTEDQEALASLVPLSVYLPEALLSLYHSKVAEFLERIYFQAHEGLELTREMKLQVAGHACLLTLKTPSKNYEKLHSVHLVPEAFQQSRETRLGVSQHHVNGVSFENGKIVLAWNATTHGAKNHFDGHNVALHEFSHQFDQEDGLADGVPRDLAREHMGEWAGIMSHGFEKIKKRSKKKSRKMIDAYGETSPAEFFAVLTETFFEKGKHLKRKEPEIYRLLSQYYGLDPANWKSRN